MFKLTLLTICMLCVAMSSPAAVYVLGTGEGQTGSGTLAMCPAQVWDTYICTGTPDLLELNYMSDAMPDGMKVRLMYRVNSGAWVTINHAWYAHVVIPVSGFDVVGVRWMYIASPYASNLYYFCAQRLSSID